MRILESDSLDSKADTEQRADHHFSEFNFPALAHSCAHAQQYKARPHLVGGVYNMAVLKDVKESFVRDLSGTTYTEVYIIVCSSVAWVVVRHLGLLGLPTVQHWHRKSRV